MESRRGSGRSDRAADGPPRPPGRRPAVAAPPPRCRPSRASPPRGRNPRPARSLVASARSVFGGARAAGSKPSLPAAPRAGPRAAGAAPRTRERRRAASRPPPTPASRRPRLPPGSLKTCLLQSVLFRPSIVGLGNPIRIARCGFVLPMHSYVTHKGTREGRKYYTSYSTLRPLHWMPCDLRSPFGGPSARGFWLYDKVCTNQPGRLI